MQMCTVAYSARRILGLSLGVSDSVAAATPTPHLSGWLGRGLLRLRSTRSFNSLRRTGKRGTILPASVRASHRCITLATGRKEAVPSDFPEKSPRQPPLRATPLTASRITTSDMPWETVPNWCELCVEPINSWQTHAGKREHMCLELVFNSLVETPRTYEIGDVLDHTEAFLSHYCKKPRKLSPMLQCLLKGGLCVPGVDSSLNIFLESFDRANAHERREGLLQLLLYLNKQNMLCLTPDLMPAAVFQGFLVLKSLLWSALVRIFPRAEVKYHSAMMQSLTSTYSSKAVFDTCGLECLLPPSLLLSRGIKPEAHSSLLSSFGEDGNALPGGGVDGSNDPLAKVFTKGDGDSSSAEADASMGEHLTTGAGIGSVIPRAILGSLRWAVEPDVTPSPAFLLSDEKRFAHLTILAAEAAHQLVNELVFLRLSEFVTRLENVLHSDWGRAHLESCPDKLPLPGKSSSSLRSVSAQRITKQRIVPPLSSEGARVLGGGGLDASGLSGSVASEHNVRLQDEARKIRCLGRRRGLIKASPNSPKSRDVRYR